jgi:hypothetical protein
MYTIESSVSEYSYFEAKTATEKLKWYKLPDGDQILAELIHSEVHKHTDSVSSKEELLDQQKESSIEPIYKKGVSTLINYMQHFCKILLPELTSHIHGI